MKHILLLGICFVVLSGVSFAGGDLDHPFLLNGTISNTYRMTWSDGTSFQSVDLSIQTSLIEPLCAVTTCHKTVYDPNVSERKVETKYFPIELRVRGKLGDLEGISLQNLKIGIYRFLLHKAGTAVQFI